MNSYRRLWDTRLLGAGLRRLGLQNRTTGLRIIRAGRFEYRSVDSMVNPHLMAGAILKAADDGIRTTSIRAHRKTATFIRPWKPASWSGKLPMTLGAALDALAEDEVIQAAMPGDMYRLYEEYKRDEWERFLHTTTEWDTDTYLNCLP